MNFPLGKTLLGAMTALALLFFAVPILDGGSTNICQDAALHNLNTTTSRIAGSDMYMVINTAGPAGDAAQQKQAQHHPHVPAVVSCAGVFWQSL